MINHIKHTILYLKGYFMVDMIGFDNGFVKVVEYAGKNKKQRTHLWKCECRCGNFVIRPTAEIKSARIKRCNTCSYGVTRGNWSNHHIDHGLARGGIRHPLVKMRNRMMTRCYNASESDFPYYQGKGIKVCDDWKNNPKSFYDWAFLNNWKEGLSIDRIDSSKDYCPENCRFITASENSKRVVHKKIT